MRRYYLAWQSLLSLMMISSAGADEVKQPASTPGVLFSSYLLDAPGKQMVVVGLEFPPRPKDAQPISPLIQAHRHPGSVYVYVTKGVARLGLQGLPIQTVHAGESFFEPMGAIHTIAESASTEESASAIAVMLVPEGKALVSPATGP